LTQIAALIAPLSGKDGDPEAFPGITDTFT
jgi:hypothetical protein